MGQPSRLTEIRRAPAAHIPLLPRLAYLREREVTRLVPLTFPSLDHGLRARGFWARVQNYRECWVIDRYPVGGRAFGRLAGSLRSAGYTPEKVDIVLVTARLVQRQTRE
jgi:hypothetical protein